MQGTTASQGSLLAFFARASEAVLGIAAILVSRRCPS